MIMTCYESRKAGQDYPACCKNKDCDAERKANPIHRCEMVKIGDSWVDNQSHNGLGKSDGHPLVPTAENMAEAIGINAGYGEISPGVPFTGIATLS